MGWLFFLGLQTGHVVAVKHENNLLSIYKHNSVLLKEQVKPRERSYCYNWQFWYGRVALTYILNCGTTIGSGPRTIHIILIHGLKSFLGIQYTKWVAKRNDWWIKNPLFLKRKF